MIKQQFNVLLMDFNHNQIEPYDVLPYFRREWKAKQFQSKLATNKRKLKLWIERAARYQFWARCEYEFLILPWPNRTRDDAMAVLGYEGKNYHDLPKDVQAQVDSKTDTPYKIDVFEQIMNNIDIITEILYKEFLKHKNSDESKPKTKTNDGR